MSPFDPDRNSVYLTTTVSNYGEDPEAGGTGVPVPRGGIVPGPGTAGVLVPPRLGAVVGIAVPPLQAASTSANRTVTVTSKSDFFIVSSFF